MHRPDHPREQAGWAREAVGLPARIELADYRDFNASRAAAASTARLRSGCSNMRDTATGQAYFQMARRSLHDDGLFLLHTIGKNCPGAATDPLDRSPIFPNGRAADGGRALLAAEREFRDRGPPYNFGADYDPTLMAWLERRRRLAPTAGPVPGALPPHVALLPDGLRRHFRARQPALAAGAVAARTAEVTGGRRPELASCATIGDHEPHLRLDLPVLPGQARHRACRLGLPAEHGGNIEEAAQYNDHDTGLFFMRVQLPRLGLEPGRVAPRGGSVCPGARHGVAPARARDAHADGDHGQPAGPLPQRPAVPLEERTAADRHPRHRQQPPRLLPARGQLRHSFHHLPVTAASKAQVEARQLEIIEQEGAELVVLARYMQVLSNDMCARLGPGDQHPSQLPCPASRGKPYYQAHDRGVKLIGATAHYVTADLDEGPIIEQDVTRVDHGMTVDDLTAIGRDTESQVLARAVMAQRAPRAAQRPPHRGVPLTAPAARACHGRLAWYSIDRQPVAGATALLLAA